MPYYRYTTIDKAGRKHAGMVDARSKDLALSLLKSQGFYVVKVVEKKPSIFASLVELRGVPTKETVAFTRQFSTMISAGLPMSNALDVLAKQTTNDPMRKVLFNILQDIEGGSSLSEALGKYPDVFSVTYQSLVRAGEYSGKLDILLQKLAENLEDRAELKAKFISALIYPAIVVLAMVGVFFVLMLYVVPKLATMYESLNVDLPFLTIIMIGISNFMVRYMYVLVLGAVGMFFGLRYFFGTTRGKELLSELSFRAPVLGKLNSRKELTEFTRTFSLLIGSAVPIVESLNIAAQAITNKGYQEAALSAARYVEKGNTLSEYFKKNPAFPKIFGQMVSVGEETGKMDEVLEKLADYFDGEVDSLIKGFSAAVEPLILILLGSMVGLLIISIITPIYKITSAI